MNSLDELRQELGSALSRNQSIGMLFGQALTNRASRDDFLENVLVRPLLMDRDLSDLSNAIDVARQHIQPFDPFRKKLRGTEPDFDDKMADWWAEARAVQMLSQRGLRKFEPIAEEDFRTPDFLVRMCGCVLVEAKHIRPPNDELWDCVRAQLEIAFLQEPELFGNHHYSVTAGLEFDASDEQVIKGLVGQLRTSLAQGKGDFECSSPVRHGRDIRVAVGRPVSRLSFDVSFNTAAWDDPAMRQKLLDRLAQKLHDKLQECMPQFREYEEQVLSDTCFRYAVVVGMVGGTHALLQLNGADVNRVVRRVASDLPANTELIFTRSYL